MAPDIPLQGLIIIECMVARKGRLQIRLGTALDHHAAGVGYVEADFSLVLPGNLARRPDIAFWAVKPTDAQIDRPKVNPCPPPNLWVEVSCNR